MKLYDSAFSPFARKVRMVLEHKGLPFEAVDGLLKSSHAALQAVNGRVEVPVLVDDGITVVNSADIVAYLEFRYPEKPVYPSDPAARVHARAWERTADTLIDAVLVNLSYWKLLDRHDAMPAGLLEKARADMGARLCRAGTGPRRQGVRVRRAVDCRHRAVPAHRVRPIHGGGVRQGGTPQSRPLARHHASAAHLRRRPAARPRLHRRHQGARPREEAHLLARRPHRVDAVARLPRLVLPGNRRGRVPVAGTCAVPG